MKCRFAPSWDGAALDANGVHAIQRVAAVIDAAVSIAALARFQSLDLFAIEGRQDEFSIRLTAESRVMVRLSDTAAPELEILSLELEAP